MNSIRSSKRRQVKLPWKGFRAMLKSYNDTLFPIPGCTHDAQHAYICIVLFKNKYLLWKKKARTFWYVCTSRGFYEKEENLAERERERYGESFVTLVFLVMKKLLGCHVDICNLHKPYKSLGTYVLCSFFLFFCASFFSFSFGTSNFVQG